MKKYYRKISSINDGYYVRLPKDFVETNKERYVLMEVRNSGMMITKV